MKGLILNDFYNNISSIKLIAGFTMVYGFIGKMTDNYSTIMGLCGLCSLLSVLTLADFDERANFMLTAKTSPVAYKNIVLARYISTIGLNIIYVLMVTAFILVVSPEDKTKLLVSVFAICVVAVFITSILIPTIYKIGVLKARYVIVGSSLVITAVIVILSKTLFSNESEITAFLNSVNFKAIGIASMPIAVISLVISYYVSVLIYSKKEC